jgi:hypothetical protein
LEISKMDVRYIVTSSGEFPTQLNREPMPDKVMDGYSKRSLHVL